MSKSPSITELEAYVEGSEKKDRMNNTYEEKIQVQSLDILTQVTKIGIS